MSTLHRQGALILPKKPLNQYLRRFFYTQNQFLKEEFP
nr:MAG TPA: hypothetical protein [Bacteriophage sp.]